MSDYQWPGFPVSRFQMRIDPLTKNFPSPYSNQLQTVDMMADVWGIQIDLAPGGPRDVLTGRALQAFFDRLKGSVNRVILWDLQQPVPLGTMRGSPVLAAAAAQLTNSIQITTTPFATLQPSDRLGVGGQLVSVMTFAEADSNGNIIVEIGPRLRNATAAGTPVAWLQPTAPFILPKGGVAVDWEPGMFTAPSFDLRESF